MPPSNSRMRGMRLSAGTARNGTKRGCNSGRRLAPEHEVDEGADAQVAAATGQHRDEQQDVEDGNAAAEAQPCQQAVAEVHASTGHCRTGSGAAGSSSRPCS